MNDKFAELRRRAEQALAQADALNLEGDALENMRHLLSELQIYQIELEMQNEELQQVQAQLFREREKYASLYNFAPVAYLTVDKNGVISELNLAAAELLGHEPRYLMGRPVTPYLTPEALNEFILNRRRARDSGTPQTCELIIRRRDGKSVIVLAHTIILEHVENPLWRTVMTDITARKQLEDTLRKFSLAVEQTGNMVLITDANGTIEFVNPAFCQTTGFSPAEVIGKNPRILKSGQVDPAIYQTLWATLRRGEVWQGEWANQKKNGEIYWEATSISPIKNAAGRITHFVAVNTDITARKQAEQAAQEYTTQLAAARDAAEQANRAKSLFLANMSHELRPPLAVIIGYSEMLLETFKPQTDSHARHQPKLERILNTARHLLTIINDILDFSKIEAGHMEVVWENFALPPLIQEVSAIIQPILAENHNQLELNIAPEITMFYSDSFKVRQVLLNLLSNAAKFTQHGWVRLRAHYVSEATGEWLSLEVQDTGIGMTPDQVSGLFTAFKQAEATTRKYGGTGLGLTICQRLCQLLGGEITVKSVEGQGSVFTCRLPQRTTPVPPPTITA